MRTLAPLVGIVVVLAVAFGGRVLWLAMLDARTEAQQRDEELE